eukprot:CAMPEP_0117741980 /NCGR_PEP_ID=MMETSP0947-20121206/5257_1 /TAXON_ID=44440 /ORGANISM="Chattonella subsalsa, Strain CCMP2191" /LENGTH=67 /DNA_ID=CAMNT_0005558383 /DNA_START=259 /DNA_END=459 /DNA_ORIENTATION=-
MTTLDLITTPCSAVCIPLKEGATNPMVREMQANTTNTSAAREKDIPAISFGKNEYNVRQAKKQRKYG